jgi:Family of unknown function (DUF6326)
MELFFL